MKKVFIYANKSINEIAIEKDIAECYIVSPDNWQTSQILDNDQCFAIADADNFDNNFNLFINTYKKFNAKLYAYTNNPTKENILKLYAYGFDNVVQSPKELNIFITNIINPENEDISLKDAEKYAYYKNVLIFNDNKINTELLLKSLENFDFAYTIRTISNTINTDIQKDKFDLIIIECKTPTEDVYSIAEQILKSKFNKNTPFILISDSLEATNKLKTYNTGSFYCIEKPYNPEILQAQVKNILKIKELQNELKKENTLLDSMITNSFNQLIITDSNFVILGGGNQHIQIERNEYFFNILKNKNIDIPEEEIRIFTRNSEKNIKFNIKTQNKTYELAISKVFKDTEAFEQYLIIIEDITEKTLIEEQKETFIATLTHDLKSPIRAEQNILKQLLDERFGTLTLEQKNILQEMLNSRDYESKMIENLLTRYHSSSQNFKLFVEKADYTQTLEEAISETKHLFDAKNQTLNLKYESITKTFDYDKTEIKRVLSNLLQNASEYTFKNGEINILVTDSEHQITTSVSDNGYGISQEDLKHIFDKNVTLAKKYRKVGAGLGLYICKTLIIAHNGTINATSELNKGSTFTFTLPKSVTN